MTPRRGRYRRKPARDCSHVDRRRIPESLAIWFNDWAPHFGFTRDQICIRCGQKVSDAEQGRKG